MAPKQGSKAQNPKPVLTPPPVKPIQESPGTMIMRAVDKLREAAFKSNVPEEVQNALRTVDAILKDVSALQSRIGEIRREISAHAQTLRQVRPKGKPEEGCVRELPNGSSVIYLEGAWYDYIPNPPQVINEREDDVDSKETSEAQT